MTTTQTAELAPATRAKLIARRIAKGGNAEEAPDLLDGLLFNTGNADNLAAALMYWSFATERGALAAAAEVWGE